MTTFRACYYIAPDGQSDILLTNEEHATLSDDELLTAAMAEADQAGLPEFLVRESEAEAEGAFRGYGDPENVEVLTLKEARKLVRRQLCIGDYAA
jgi:hypothetical protein